MFDKLTRKECVKALILDDSVIKRNRSKKVELLARVYDHVGHKFQKGFTLLALGCSDSYSFVPVGFNMLSSPVKSNWYQEISTDIDRHSNGYRVRKVLMGQGTSLVLFVLPPKRNSDKGCICMKPQQEKRMSVSVKHRLQLIDAEIVHIYGNKWFIECFFKASKSFLKLGTEFQSRNYDAMVSHTAIVFTRYIIRMDTP